MIFRNQAILHIDSIARFSLNLAGHNLQVYKDQLAQVGYETMINAYVILILIEVLNFDT